MNKRALQKLIPEQKTGSQTGASAYKNCATQLKAKKLYQSADEKLYDINRWGDISGEASAEFCLTDEVANPILNSQPREGNFIRIKLPAPPNTEGAGYDWVKIEKIETFEDTVKDYEWQGIQVKPSAHPDQSEKNPTAHFYTKRASSTFLIIRQNNTVWAMELGRNEVPNTQTNLCNSIRNFIIAIGANLGIAKLQWQSLMKGFLE